MSKFSPELKGFKNYFSLITFCCFRLSLNNFGIWSCSSMSSNGGGKGWSYLQENQDETSIYPILLIFHFFIHTVKLSQPTHHIIVSSISRYTSHVIIVTLWGHIVRGGCEKNKSPLKKYNSKYFYTFSHKLRIDHLFPFSNSHFNIAFQAFLWDDYLKESGAEAAPSICFKQVSTFFLYLSFSPSFSLFLLLYLSIFFFLFQCLIANVNG